jgi:thiol-disulfide isomerase/thioredoxin
MDQLQESRVDIDEDDDGVGSSPRLSNLYELQTVQDYKKLVEDCDNTLTVVHFSAPSFCLACKAAAPAIRKMAEDMPDVNFVLVSVTKDNRHGVRDLGVPSLPYGYVHHPQAGLVERLSNNKRHLPDFARVVESYRGRRCPLPDDADAESGIFASPYVRAA